MEPGDISPDSPSIQTLCDPLLSAFNQPTLPFFALDSPAANLPQKEGGHDHRIWRIFTAHFPLRSDLPHHQSFKLKNFLNEMLNLSLFCPNLSYNSLDVYNSGGGVVPNSDAYKYGDPSCLDLAIYASLSNKWIVCSRFTDCFEEYGSRNLPGMLSELSRRSLRFGVKWT